MWRESALAGVLCASPVLAQDAAFEIRVLGDFTPATPDVEIEVWAHFPQDDYAWASARFSLFSSSAEFFQASCDIRPVECALSGGLEVTPERVLFHAGQIHFPPPVIGDPSNPIQAASAWWRTTDFTPRVVELWTETTEFLVYIEPESSASESRLNRLVEGRAFIRVLDRECYTDCDASGELDFADFLCFQNLFAAADPLADCDLSGALDFFDFLCFQNGFAAGCP